MAIFDANLQFCLAKVFEISFDESNPLAVSSFLQDLKSGSWKPDQRSAIDRLLLEKGCSTEDVLSYFFQCHKRALNVAVTSVGKNYVELLQYIGDQCVAHSALCLVYPEMFPQYSNQQDAVDNLVCRWLGTGEMSQHYWHGLIERLAAPDLNSVGAALLPAMLKLSNTASKSQLVGDAAVSLPALKAIAKEKTLLKAIFESPEWRPAASNGETFQRNSFLGPFFGFSVLPDTAEGECSTGRVYFRDLTTRRAPVDAETDSLRIMSEGVVSGLHEVMVNMLKPEETRDFVLDWIADAIQKNVGRTQEGHGLFRAASLTSSEGFAANLFLVLVRLCKPFIDPSNDPKNLIGKIDSTFFLSKHRIDLSKETKLASTDEDVARWVDPRNHARIQQFNKAAAASTSSSSNSSSGGDSEELVVSEKFGTISEYFFLTLRALHVLSPGKMTKKYYEINKAIGEAMNLGEGSEALQHAYERRFATDALYGDDNFALALLSFSRLVCVWLLRVARAPPTVVPLPLPPPKVFASLPEHVLESVADVFIFLATVNFASLEQMLKQDLHDCMTAFIAFASSPAHVKNPYLRGKIIQILSNMVPEGDHFSRGGGFVATIFNDHSLLKKQLIPLLVKFYVDIEVTGSHTQFYDKFTYRHYIAILLRYLWREAEYRQALKAESEKEAFVQFVNMLINDATWCTDESLNSLQEIHKLEEDKLSWAALPPQERAEKEAGLSRAIRLCQYTMQQANEVIEIICYLTEEIVAPFMAKELRDRIAATLNYILVQIAGPKCMELKVQDPDAVQFRPKELLKRIIDIYLHLACHHEFHVAVARDGRSFDPKVFQKAAAILVRNHLHDAASVDRFLKISSDALSASNEDEDLAKILGDIPDEYMDPISCELIRDPVRLPSSGQIIDRSTIARHVLSDQTDPFNRDYLTAEMVKELKTDQELLDRIEAFVQQRKAEAASKQG